MKLSLLLITLSANASPIAPGPVWSSFPQWVAPCDGYTQGPQPWGCSAGEIRTIDALGEVRTLMLAPSHFEPLVDTPVSTPAAPVAAVAATPVVSAVPEPSYAWLLLMAGMVSALVREFRRSRA